MVKAALAPEQIVVFGPTVPFSGIPKVSGVLVHRLELGELPLTEANFVTLITPGLLGSQMLIPKLPKGTLNSKNVAPELQLALPA
ncbi:hypothetical protein FF52_18430 [Flavobacterium sp. F52]|nr:hypothetical protein FF52_18430 [Flavobacterium sp. F52]